MSELKNGGVLFIFTWLLHTAEHVRRRLALTSDGVRWAGTAAAVVAAIALTFVFTDHPLAPFAVVAGFGSLAFGTAATHLAPSWGYFSEPLVFGSVADGWALGAALAEIVAASWLTWLGLQILRTTNFQLEQGSI